MQSGLSFFSELSRRPSEWLLSTGTERQFIANSEIIREGQPCAAFYIVLEGLLSVSIAEVSENAIARLGPGELIGDVSFLEKSSASATVAALESSLLLEIPRSAVEAHLKSDAEFAADFYRALAVLNAQRLRERVGSLSSRWQEKLEVKLGPHQAGDELNAGIQAFKDLVMRADTEGLKNNGIISDATIDRAVVGFLDFSLLMNKLIGDAAKENASVKAELGTRAQREILPYLLLTRTAERFYSKPRGYAGDFLTIEMIYQNQPGGAGRIGGLLDRCFLDSPPGVAVRNRRRLMASEILKTVHEKEQPAKVTSLACGPAEEVFDSFKLLSNQGTLQASLVDIDLQALAHVADRRDKAKLQTRMTLMNGNLVYLAMGRQQLDLKDQDLIYSIGLIDYFNDKFVVKLLNWIFDRLRTGGRVIVGNFHPNNYAKAVMDHVFDWKLIHRSEEQMNQLFASSSFGVACTRIQFEPERINLFAECVKA